MAKHAHKWLGVLFIIYGAGKIIFGLVSYVIYGLHIFDVQVPFNPIWALLISIVLGGITIASAIALFQDKSWSYPFALVWAVFLLAWFFMSQIFWLIILYLVLLVATALVYFQKKRRDRVEKKIKK